MDSTQIAEIYVNNPRYGRARLFLPLQIGNRPPVKALLKTGTACNLMSEQFFRSLHLDSQLAASSDTFSIADGTKVHQLGSFMAKVSIDGKVSCHLLFYVIKNLAQPILLGTDAIVATGMLLDYPQHQVLFRQGSHTLATFEF